MSRHSVDFEPSFAPFYNGVSVREEDGVNYIYVGVKSEHDPSFEEARCRHYLFTGRTSLPESGTWSLSTAPSTPACAYQAQAQPQAFSESSSMDIVPSDLNPGAPPAVVTAADGESGTSNSTCSLCADRLAISGQRELEEDGDSRRVGTQSDEEGEGYGGPADEAGAETPSVSPRRRFDNEKGVRSSGRSSKRDRRLRRLEKTVESLSHGLILALTQLNSGDVLAEPRRRSSSPGRRRRSRSHETESVSGDDTVDGDDCRNLSTAFSGKGPLENAHGGIRTMASSLKTNNAESSSSLEKDLLQSLLHGPQLSSTTMTSVASKAGPENAFSCIATASNRSLFTTSKEKSHSQMLSPVLKFITSSDVFEFLKRAEIHASLWSTQLFDLFWVLDNLFNVHGGILIYCLRKSLDTMSGISRSLGSDEWSHDAGFLRKLDEVYRKELRPHIHTDGNYNASSSVSWKSYCFELSQIFSERFSSCQSKYFRDLSESYTGCFNPVITTSYIDDLVTLWTPVHPALLEVARWLEPCIDYDPGCIGATPLHDATTALRHRACKLLSRKGAHELEARWRADCLLQLLREHRSDELVKMQLEMERAMKDVSRDFDAADAITDGGGKDHSPSGSGSGLSSESAAREVALTKRAKRATSCWQVITKTTVSPSDLLVTVVLVVALLFG
ncbi:hypothetical protein DFH94DRAFT_713329 [Russula ochroleuca]|uniref:Uncharacterized protein n=1 Tax=Russula ochroleuca TaxID=152965 RepID=A0A9P5N5B0_9AGAM|nr:hypothetical protein DFH94DRAFT_713329 [Russula ochroleuca]